MSRMIECVKLKKSLPGLGFQPYPGELGKKIYDTVSDEAWQLWLAHQTMIINEYRLNLLDKAAREQLETAMKEFLFSEDEPEKPEGFVPL